jgi:VIT1/CCC1 family predicted Fe2+/Mn2+ transporter
MEHTDIELYIQIRDGQPFEHPIFADNFRQAFPDVDTENLPDTFAKFIRVDAPVPDTYEVYEGVTYQWVDGVVKDVHSVREMTDEERAVKTQELEATANQIKVARISICDDMISKGEAVDLWQAAKDAHEAWVLESVDPIKPAFPRFPVES